MRSLTWTTFMRVVRCSSSAIMPLCVGSRCWTMTKAMPLPSGTCLRNCSSASSPPAEAPMPTMGNALCALAGCGFGGTGTAGSLFRIFESEGFFMVDILSPQEAA